MTIILLDWFSSDHFGKKSFTFSWTLQSSHPSLLSWKKNKKVIVGKWISINSSTPEQEWHHSRGSSFATGLPGFKIQTYESIMVSVCNLPSPITQSIHVSSTHKGSNDHRLAFMNTTSPVFPLRRETPKYSLGLLLRDFWGWHFVMPCFAEFCIARLVKPITTV